MTKQQIFERIIEECLNSPAGIYEDEELENGDFDFSMPDDASAFAVTIIHAYARMGLGEKIQWLEKLEGPL